MTRPPSPASPSEPASQQNAAVDPDGRGATSPSARLRGRGGPYYTAAPAQESLPAGMAQGRLIVLDVMRGADARPHGIRRRVIRAINSRRPDSNRGPLHYEGSARVPTPSGCSAFCLLTGRVHRVRRLVVSSCLRMFCMPKQLPILRAQLVEERQIAPTVAELVAVDRGGDRSVRVPESVPTSVIRQPWSSRIQIGPGSVSASPPEPSCKLWR
jgi:hypothetical protein